MPVCCPPAPLRSTRPPGGARGRSPKLTAVPTHGIFRPPPPRNEPVRDFAPGSAERHELRLTIERMRGERADVPLVIGGREIRTGDTFEAVMPHDKDHVLADVHAGGPEHVEQAV